MQNSSFSPSMLRLAGIAAILAGVFIISFAGIADSHHLFFYFDVYQGGPSTPWIDHVLASPTLGKVIMILPVLGFSCFLIVAITLFQLISEKSWQKHLSLAAYSIGTPVAVTMWILQLSLMNTILLTYGKSSASDIQIQGLASYILYFFHVVNEYFGPFFIIILGTPLMAWAAMKAHILPKWLGYIPIGCGFLVLLSFFSTFNPFFRNLSIGAPLHMLWFVLLGIILLKKASGATLPVQTIEHNLVLSDG